MYLVFSVIRTYECYQILKKEKQLTFSLSPVQYVFHTDMGVWKLMQTGCTSVHDLDQVLIILTTVLLVSAHIYEIVEAHHMSYQAGE